jgi:hypothetical protein
MSKAILSQAIAKTQARRFTFALLKELAYLHHDDYGYAYPSLAYLAQKLRASVRSIQRHLTKLEQTGELIVARVRGRGLNNRYYLKLLGFEPRPEQKHDRWSRLKTAITRAWSGENMTTMSPKSDDDLNQTVPLPSAARQTTTSSPRCVGYPQTGQLMRYCEFHGYTHFASGR